MILIDGRAALVGGMNLGAEYMGPSADPRRWQDLALRAEGPVVGRLYDIFRSDWEFAAKQSLPESVGTVCADRPRCGPAVIASGPDCPRDTIRDAIISRVFAAQSRAWIVTPYFVPDDVLLESLCMAARRGIDVRLIVPERSNHRLANLARASYLNQLQEAGAAVRLFQPTMLNAKTILFDENLAMVGSANMDMRSLLLNYEVMLTLEDPTIVGDIKSWMRSLEKSCRPRDLVRPQSLGLLEGIGRLFAPLL